MAAADNPPTSRRSSFRKSLADADLPESYLEQLEQKRRQLDDSIHKYVASKEREYKSYEKDLRLRHSRAVEEGTEARSGGVGNAAAKRRTSSESTLDAGDHAAIDAILASSSRQASSNANAVEAQKQPSRETQDLAAARGGNRRTSIERDKDFVGLFTPPFLPALQDKEGKPHLDRHSSAPTVIGSSPTEEHGSTLGDMNRALSDTVIQAQVKRPAHLKLSQRTSSSGSSVDGKLISALKSPTDHLRSKRKRVSLAVGDAIVAPSDNVPATQQTNTTPSHSRVRSPILEPREHGHEDTPNHKTNMTIAKEPSTSSLADVVQSRGRTDIRDMQPAAASAAIAGRGKETKEQFQFTLDADGDLFDLEDEAATEPFPDLPDMDAADTDPLNEVTGRIGTPLTITPEPPPIPTEQSPLPQALPTSSPPAGSPKPPSSSTVASALPVSLSFNPQSAAQPSSTANAGKVAAGFRRPSAARDPIVENSGSDGGEDSAERMRRFSDDAEASFYGSSFNKPTTTASFTGGSLGESYMARHAEEMAMRREGRSKG
ncbi:hypothetical protein MBLNU230_g7885t1 [Neophaeotheca triangularis]